MTKKYFCLYFFPEEPNTNSPGYITINSLWWQTCSNPKLCPATTSSHAYLFLKIKMTFTSIFGTLEIWWHLIIKKALDTAWESALFSITISLQLSYKWNQIDCKIKSTQLKYLQPSYTCILPHSGKSLSLFVFFPNFNMTSRVNHVSVRFSFSFFLFFFFLLASKLISDWVIENNSKCSIDSN